MSPRNLQYQSSDRGSDIVFLRKPLVKFLLLVLVASFVLFPLFQASPSFSQTNSVVINEFIPNPVGPDDASKPNGEWIELHNLAGEIDLAGWVLKDKYDNHILEVIPENTGTGGTVIESGDYLVIYRNGDGDFSLNQADDQIRLFDSVGNLVDSITYSGSVGEGKSWSLKDTEWVRGTDPTPGAKNTFPEEETKDEEEAEEQQEEKQQPQPAISFSSPSTVSVGTALSVTVNLSNFNPGTYFLKVLIGRGDKFIYGNTKGVGGWLTQNGKWAEMPQVTIGSSGSKTIQAKTDDDAAAGNYLVKVRVYDGKGTFDSDTKSLKVTGSAAPKTSSSTIGRSSGSGEEGPSSIETTEGNEEDTGGEVLGEKAAPGGSSKLNFYTILGIFGMLVGSGGLILSFAKKKVLEPEARGSYSKRSKEQGS